MQLLSQEAQQASLRRYISLLENGGDASGGIIGMNGISPTSVVGYSSGSGGSTIDDYTIRNLSSNLNSKINNFAADVITTLIRDQIRTGDIQPYSSEVETLALIPIAHAILQDLGQDQLRASPLLTSLADTLNGRAGREFTGGLGMLVQSLLRHLLSQILSDGIINELLITNSEEANIELTKVHEVLFDRE